MKTRLFRAVCACISFLALLTGTTTHAAVVEVTNYNTVQGSAGVTTLDFESGSTGVAEPPGIDFLGFSVASGWYYAGAKASRPDYQTLFGDQYLGNVSGSGGHTDISIALSQPVNFVGSWIMSAFSSVDNILFSAYGTSGNLIFEKTLTAPGNYDEIFYYGIYSTEHIANVTWHDVEDGWMQFDNLSFGNIAAPVPIPPAIYFFVSGLMAIGWCGKNQRTRLK